MNEIWLMTMRSILCSLIEVIILTTKNPEEKWNDYRGRCHACRIICSSKKYEMKICASQKHYFRHPIISFRIPTIGNAHVGFVRFLKTWTMWKIQRNDWNAGKTRKVSTEMYFMKTSFVHQYWFLALSTINKPSITKSLF